MSDEITWRRAITAVRARMDGYTDTVIGQLTETIIADLRESEARSWRSPETLPRDGRTVEVQATMLMHFMKGASFTGLPPHWRPDHPYSNWVFTGWRESVSETGGPVAARDGD